MFYSFVNKIETFIKLKNQIYVSRLFYKNRGDIMAAKKKKAKKAKKKVVKKKAKKKVKKVKKKAVKKKAKKKR